jgi:hypothetical protein
MLWFGSKKKQHTARHVTITGRPKTPRYTKHMLSPAEFKSWSVGSKSVPLTPDTLSDRGQFLKTYFSLITRYLPLASQSVWAWHNLCATRQEIKLEGGSELQRSQAAQRMKAFSTRMTPFGFSQSGGLDKLINLWFTNVFTYGRFAGNIAVSPNLDEITAFKRLDPFAIKFTKDLQPYAIDPKNPSNGILQNPNTFYYYGINMDDENPYGSAFIEAADTFMQIALDMMTDMALSSSNAGVPRLHIKVKQPTLMPNEDPANYSTRANSYFDETVSEMSELAPDDNIYSWDDVTISVAGGTTSSGSFVWATNRQVVDEEIIAAFHLFPWVVGRSASTTKNWVTSQFDLLMGQASAFQQEVKRFVEWMANADLQLAGLGDVRAVQKFSAPRDPAAKDQAIAERFRINNVTSKVLAGFIDPDAGARELGYDEAYDKKLIYTKSKIDTSKIGTADKAGRQAPEN